jgi:hypothetical protein
VAVAVRQQHWLAEGQAALGQPGQHGVEALALLVAGGQFEVRVGLHRDHDAGAPACHRLVEGGIDPDQCRRFAGLHFGLAAPRGVA